MDLNTLNENQRKAVETVEGPLLVLAGAGSGKTRVLTHRVAYLLEEKNVFPSQILAITFTNKAANEMKERVHKLIGEQSEGIWIGTFHSICVRMLRTFSEDLGYSKNFTIYDSSDQKTLIKNISKELDINEKMYTPSMLLSKISSAKNQMIEPEEYESLYKDDFFYTAIIKVYKAYQKKLKENSAMDFDDLLLNAVKLLKEVEEARDFYKRKFRYILIDEYQDTNKAQYLLSKILSEDHRNLCVVGDIDQSIYGWRGADIRNIRDFEKDFTEAKVILLEENYRSTKTILRAANEVIKNNKNRRDKNLYTNKELDEEIEYYNAYNDKNEVDFVIENIVKHKRKYGYKNQAILYRTNAQSRAFETKLNQHHIPYKIYGGLKFYERKEIKDLVAYLRLVVNPLDDLAFLRIINEPKRGAGPKAIETIASLSNSLYKGLEIALKENKFSRKVHTSLTEFYHIIERARKDMDTLMAREILENILKETGYLDLLKKQNTVESESRIANIEELVSATKDFENISTGKLEDFLSETSLMTDMDAEETDDVLLLMTLHSAKGLEFPVVYIVGMEENIFPSYRSIEEDDVEEERRLLYVGITRAMDKLFLSSADNRMQYGRTIYNRPSRFLMEIPSDCLKGEDEKHIEKYELKDNFVKKKTKEKTKKSYKIEKKEDKDYTSGMKVKHKLFGVGTIVSISGDVLTIAFDKKGIKKLQKGFAPLEVL